MDNPDLNSNLETPDALVLESYFAGDCSKYETQRIESWISAHPQHQDYVEAMRLAWRQLGHPTQIPAYNVEVELLRLSRAIQEEWDTVSVQPSQVSEFTDRILRSQTVAASTRWPSRNVVRTFGIAIGGLCTAIVLIFSGSYWTRRSVDQTLSQQVSTYSTTPGKQASVVLPDGSTVILNVDSRLDVPSDYATGNRTIHLSGEALFTVNHVEHDPFIVVAGPSTTRVLGTRFVVRHYVTDTMAVIAVEDGKVAVESTVLTAAQQVSVGERGAVSDVTPVQLGRFSFARGVLTLDNVPLSAALADLSRWYDATLQLGDPALADRILIGRFTTGSISDLVENLEWAFQLRVVRNGRTLTLYPK